MHIVPSPLVPEKQEPPQGGQKTLKIATPPGSEYIYIYIWCSDAAVYATTLDHFGSDALAPSN